MPREFPNQTQRHAAKPASMIVQVRYSTECKRNDIYVDKQASSRLHATYLVFFRSSYRLNDKISNTRHWWFRYMNWSSNLTIFASSSPSSFSFTLLRMSISVFACIKNGFLDLMILIATSVLRSWSYAQTTWPKEPYEGENIVKLLTRSKAGEMWDKYLSHLMFYYISIVHNLISAENVVVILVVVTVVMYSTSCRVLLITKFLSFRFVVNLDNDRGNTINLTCEHTTQPTITDAHAICFYYLVDVLVSVDESNRKFKYRPLRWAPQLHLCWSFFLHNLVVSIGDNVTINTWVRLRVECGRSRWAWSEVRKETYRKVLPLKKFVCDGRKREQKW